MGKTGQNTLTECGSDLENAKKLFTKKYLNNAWVCMYVRVYVHMYMHGCVCFYVHVCMYVCVCVHLYYVCMCVYEYFSGFMTRQVINGKTENHL